MGILRNERTAPSSVGQRNVMIMGAKDGIKWGGSKGHKGGKSSRASVEREDSSRNWKRREERRAYQKHKEWEEEGQEQRAVMSSIIILPGERGNTSRIFNPGSTEAGLREP